MEQVLEEVKKVIAEQACIDEEKIKGDTTFEELGLDSLDMVELVMALEEKYELEICDEEVEKITNVGEIAEYIVNNV